ncbi:hypothetical protein GCM10008931_43720 [Oceanobacillus oncorhynchi subsp. oncorhynchi]|uniref:hypothetical protein n=1 Tax=Oceanobacillus oncorhynchi TaxID=545501 RepID=UPI0031CFAB78
MKKRTFLVFIIFLFLAGCGEENSSKDNKEDEDPKETETTVEQSTQDEKSKLALTHIRGGLYIESDVEYDSDLSKINITVTEEEYINLIKPIILSTHDLEDWEGLVVDPILTASGTILENVSEGYTIDFKYMEGNEEVLLLSIKDGEILYNLADEFNEEPVRDVAHMTESEMTEEILTILRESYEGEMEVSYDEENSTFILLPISEDLKDAIVSMVLHTEVADAWNEHVVKNTVGLSESISTLQDHTLVIANPSNPELYVLAVYNGVVMYNVTDDY